jgi:uncharacterized small protein (DUF1192 family)
MRKMTIALMAGLVFLGLATILMLFHLASEGRLGRTKNTTTSSQPGEEEQTPSQNDRASEGTASVAALLSEVASLRREIEALKAENSRLAQGNAAGEHRKETPPLNPAEAKEDSKNKLMEMLAQTQERFLREPSDAYWSSAKKASIRALADKSESLRHAIRNVDCRSHTCRVELIDDAAAKLGENLSFFQSELATTLPNVTTDWEKAPDGTGTYILYMSGS